jgi:molecular chaperone GrpE
MPASDTPVPEEMGGPVIHDHRRIDPVTGQVRRGKHAASKPAGTQGAGRPGPASEPEAAVSSGPRSTERSEGATREDDTSKRPPVSEPMSTERSERATREDDTSKRPPVSEQISTASEPGNTELQARLDERTSDLQRLQAEYANYRKRVERDRVAVKEQAVAATLSGLLPVLDDIDRAKEHGELSGGFKSVADQLHAAVSRLGLVSYGEKGDPFDPKIHEALMHSYSSEVTEDTCVEILQPGYKVGERILRPARVAVAEPELPEAETGEPGTADEEGN